MRKKRIFINFLDNKMKFIKLDRDSREYHHLIHVLRIKRNDIFEGFDGKGNIVNLRLVKNQKNYLIFEVVKFDKLNYQKSKINLAVGIPKFNKLNSLLKPLIELSVANIFLFFSEFSQVQTVSASQIQKINNIIIDAGKQSGNNFLPFVDNIYNFMDILNLPFEEKLFFHPYSENNFSNYKFKENKDILIVIGPEGGFSDNEVNSLHNKGFYDIKFSGNILRTETAAITSTAILKFIKGEI